MPLSSSIQLCRDALRSRCDIQFIEPDKFCQLLTSRDNYERADEPNANAQGLRDPITGTRFLVENELLFPPAALAF